VLNGFTLLANNATIKNREHRPALYESLELATWIYTPPVVGIAAFRMLYPPGKKRIVLISLSRSAAALILRRASCYLNSIANGVPLSLLLFLHKDVGHRNSFLGRFSEQAILHLT
jgi:hypothetical protein